MVLQPQDALEVQVVGRLVQKEYVGFLRERAGQRQPLPPPLRRGCPRRIRSHGSPACPVRSTRGSRRRDVPRGRPPAASSRSRAALIRVSDRPVPRRRTGFRDASTSPASGSSRPARIFRRVDLPAPFGPMRPTRSPSSTWRLIESEQDVRWIGLGQVACGEEGRHGFRPDRTPYTHWGGSRRPGRRVPPPSRGPRHGCGSSADPRRRTAAVNRARPKERILDRSFDRAWLRSGLECPGAGRLVGLRRMNQNAPHNSPRPEEHRRIMVAARTELAADGCRTPDDRRRRPVFPTRRSSWRPSVAWCSRSPHDRGARHHDAGRLDRPQHEPRGVHHPASLHDQARGRNDGPARDRRLHAGLRVGPRAVARHSPGSRRTRPHRAHDHHAMDLVDRRPALTRGC